ncbi:MAG: hypothetical protein JW936_08585 [Sedimentisphaerales bacterium]|nr:hypothetical protein [Sedimentisphaerales bacterium]
MRIILILFAAPIILLGFALLVMLVPLPGPLPEARSDGRNLIAAISTGILALIGLVTLTIHIVRALRLSGNLEQSLLEPFTKETFTCENYQVVGRKFQGQVAGCSVQAEFIPPKAMQHALLNIYVQADIGFNAAIGAAKPILAQRGCKQVELADEVLKHLRIYSDNEEQLKNLLQRSEYKQAIAQLLSEQKLLGLRELYIQPKKIHLRARPTAAVTSQHTEQWLKNLITLAGRNNPSKG